MKYSIREYLRQFYPVEDVIIILTLTTKSQLETALFMAYFNTLKAMPVFTPTQIIDVLCDKGLTKAHCSDLTSKFYERKFQLQ